MPARPSARRLRWGGRADDLDFDPDGVYLPGEVYSRLLAARYEQGSYYTPPGTARWQSKLGRMTTSPTMLDPAMGGGTSCWPAGEMIARGGASRAGKPRSTCGLDSDAGAVDLARLALWLWAAEPGTTPTCRAALCGRCWRAAPARFDAVLATRPAPASSRAGRRLAA